MRKQKLSILIGSILISIVLLLFYIPPFFANTKQKSVEIETLFGEENTIESVRLMGHHYFGNRESLLTVSKEGTQYLMEDSALSASLRGDLVVKALRKEFPSFMRGKSGYSGNYLDGKQYLFYLEDYYSSEQIANSSVPLAMERLEKETGEVDIRQIEVAAAGHIQSFQVLNFQTEGSILSIHLTVFDEDFEQQEFVYVYDWDTGKVLGRADLAMLQTPHDSGSSSTMVALSGTEQPRLLLQKTHYTYSETADGSSAESKETRFWIYDVGSGEVKEIAVPDEWTNESWQYLFDGGFLYFTHTEPESLDLKVFDTQTEQVIKERLHTLSLELFPESEVSGSPLLIDLDDTHLLVGQFLLEKDAEAAGMVVIEKSTGEVVYEGRLQLNNAKNQPWEAEEFIYFRHFELEAQ